MDKLTVRDADVAGKRVFVRVDFNVPIADGKVQDDSRIRAAIPTIATLVGAGAKVILASHLGRPNGKVTDSLRLRPVGQRLTELIRRNVAVIVTTGGTSVAKAAKATGTAIPIVFALGSDPVEDGLVTAMNRPGGNVTGVSFFSNLLIVKRLEMLREIAPMAALIAVLVNPNNARAQRDTADMQTGASAVGQRLLFLRAGTARDLGDFTPVEDVVPTWQLDRSWLSGTL